MHFAIYTDMLEYSKNTENYFDCDESDRPLWFLASKASCPFGDHCKAWDKHKHQMWSAIDEEHVKAYVKQHAMASSNHHGSSSEMTNWMSEEAIDQLVETLEVPEVVDTKKDRDDWGKNVQHVKDKAAEAKATHGKKRPSDDSDAALVQQLSSQVASLQAQLIQDRSAWNRSLGQGVRPAIMPPGLPAQPDSMMRELLAEPAPQPGSEVQTVLVNMQASQLQLLLDTVRRSKEAVKSSMNACIQHVNVLKGDLTVLHNAEQLIQENMIQVTQRAAR